MKKPTRMDGYVRVSRRMGREGPGYISPEVQREAIQRWADYRGVTIPVWETDEDESGGTQARPGLQRILERIDRGETDGIVCWRLNRFARNVAGAIGDVQRIQTSGGHLAFVEEDVDPTGPFGSFILTVLLAVATLERDNIVSGWKTAKARAMERGAKIGPTPLGYLRQPDGTLQADAEHAPILVRAYELAAAGDFAAAVKMLREKIPEREWKPSEVRRVLANRSYLGEVHYAGSVRRDAHPAIVDRTTWKRAQTAAPPPAAKALPYPLSGLATCRECGEIMVGTRGGRDRLRSYRCRASIPSWKGKRCAGATILADRLEQYVIERVRSDYAAAEEHVKLTNAGTSTSELEDAQVAVDAAERELERFAVDVTAADSLGPAVWDAALQARADAVDAARATYLQLVPAHDDNHFSLPPLAVLDSLEPADMHEVLRITVKRCAIARGRGALDSRVVLELHGEGTTVSPLKDAA